jgi:tetratricopeptide (TPR) repeat protein
VSERREWIGEPRHLTIELEPLDTEATARLAASYPSVDGHVRERIGEAAGGNPLFLLEMLRAVGDTPSDDIDIPPTLHALFASRMELLAVEDVEVLWRAAVVGERFSPDLLDSRSEPEIAPLIEHGWVQPTGDDGGLTFSHPVMREAAYRCAPKAFRAERHERVADLLGAEAFDDPDVSVAVGFHLERAHELRAELFAGDERLPALATRAAEHLTRAGRAAFAVRDLPAAVDRLRRAVALVGEDRPAAGPPLVALGRALAEAGRFAEAKGALGRAVRCARSMNDERLEARAAVEDALLLFATGDSYPATDVEALTARVIPILEAAGDYEGLARASYLASTLAWNQMHAAEAERANERAALYARLAGDHDWTIHQALRTYQWVLGPTPVDEALQRCLALLPEVERDPGAAATVHANITRLEAMRGRHHDARRSFERFSALRQRFGLHGELAIVAYETEWFIEMHAGDPASAVEALLRWRAQPHEMGGIVGSAVAGLLAIAACASGDDRLANRELATAERLGYEDDLLLKAWVARTRGILLARRGESERAVALARTAVRMVGSGDLLGEQGDAWMGLAEVLRISGRRREAEEAATEAFDRYQRKGIVVMAQRARTTLAELASKRERVSP